MIFYPIKEFNHCEFEATGSSVLYTIINGLSLRIGSSPEIFLNTLYGITRWRVSLHLIIILPESFLPKFKLHLLHPLGIKDMCSVLKNRIHKDIALLHYYLSTIILISFDSREGCHKVIIYRLGFVFSKSFIYY